MTRQLIKHYLLWQPRKQAIFSLLIIIHRRTFPMHDTIRWAHNFSWNKTVYYLICKENTIRQLLRVLKIKYLNHCSSSLMILGKANIRQPDKQMKHTDVNKDLKCHLQKPLQCTATPCTHQTKGRQVQALKLSAMIFQNLGAFL